MTSTQLTNLNKINELKDLFEDDLSGFFDLFVEFESSTKNIIATLKVEIEQNNIKKIIHLAHTLKGFSGNLGLERLSQLMSVIENSIDDENGTDISTVIVEVESVFNETLKECVANGYLK